MASIGEETGEGRFTGPRDEEENGSHSLTPPMEDYLMHMGCVVNDSQAPALSSWIPNANAVGNLDFERMPKENLTGKWLSLKLSCDGLRQTLWEVSDNTNREHKVKAMVC